MKWKELIGTEKDIRLSVIEDDADIVKEFRTALSFIQIDEVAAFEMTCIAFNDGVSKEIFPSTPKEASKYIRSSAGYANATKTKALRANIHTTKGMEAVIIVRKSVFNS